MLPRIICSVGIFVVHGWLLLERIFFSIFPTFTKKKVREAFLISGVNSDLIKINDERFYITVANKGLIGLAVASGKGWVEVEDLERVMKNVLKTKKHINDVFVRYKLFLEYLEHYFFNHPENFNSSREVFYEIDYDLLKSMLGNDLSVSAGTYNSEFDSLETAQQNAADGMAAALELRPGNKVMDIGCGWGGRAKYLAERHGVSVIATTISPKGFEAVKLKCAHLDVTPLLVNCNEQVFPTGLDAAYALMLIMNLRRDNRRNFFKRVAEALKPNGLFFLQFTGSLEENQPRINALTNKVYEQGEGSSLVYLAELIKDIEGLFTLKSLKDVGKDAVLMEREFLRRFHRNKEEWENKMGKYYSCLVETELVTNMVAIQLKDVQVWDIVLCKKP